MLGGLHQKRAAKLFGVTPQAVCGWMRLQRQGGAAALRAQRRGRPAGKRLANWQAAQIAKLVVDRLPDQLKLPFYLWTREAVGQLITQRFGFKLSVWTVGRYLADWGYTPQRPVKRAFEKDPAAVQKWLTEEYPAIRNRAKRLKATIYWGDEMGLRSDHATGTSYAPRGRTPAVPGTGRRFGCNMISALTNRGQLAFMVLGQRFRAPVFIEMFFMPGYSPELNPDEYLNNDVKANAVGRRRARDRDELVGNVRGYLRSTQKYPTVVVSFFENKHVRYAAN